MAHPLSKFKFCPVCGSPNFVENNFKSKKCTSCGFVYYFNTSSAVVAVIVNPEGDLLVTRRGIEPGKGALDLPGGFVDMDETSEDAVCREVREELNLEIKELKYLMTLPNRYPYSGFEVHTLDSFFKCEVDDFSLMKVDDDVSDAFFMKWEDLDADEFGLQSIKNGISILKDGLVV